MDINDRIERLKENFYQTDDLVIKELTVSGKTIMFVYIDFMIDKAQLEQSVIRAIVESRSKLEPTLESINKIVFSCGDIKAEKEFSRVVESISSGECAMLIEGNERETFILPIRSYPMRAVSEPPTSAVLSGPREGFIEDMKTNMVLLRRRIRSNKLIFKTIVIGRVTETAVSIAYIEGITDMTLVEEILETLKKVDIDGIIDSSYVGKMLQAKPYSLFRQVGTTEKPDILTAKLLEGRVAILVDGSPMALTLPFMIFEAFQDSQDYYIKSGRATLLRLIRLGAVFFSLLLPGVYVALQTHQFQMLPLKLLITIINSVNEIPFSPLVEMLVALVLFEMLNEASVRMPRYVGMAISIVGAIVLGETAVKAGVLSSITVLITALSGIGLYVIPDEVGTFSVMRFFFVFIAGAVGYVGMVFGMVCLLSYLSTIEVYGTPYLAPYAPMVFGDQKDGFIKQPLEDREFRPKSINNKNKRRQDF